MRRIGTLIATRPKRILGLTAMVTLLAVVALFRISFNADVASPSVAAALARDGCAIVERLVPPAALARVRDELAPWLAATPYGQDRFAGQRTRRTGGLIARSPACRDLVQHPVVLGAVGLLRSRSNCGISKRPVTTASASGTTSASTPIRGAAKR